MLIYSLTTRNHITENKAHKDGRNYCGSVGSQLLQGTGCFRLSSCFIWLFLQVFAPELDAG